MEPEATPPKAMHPNETVLARCGIVQEVPRNAKMNWRTNGWLLLAAGALALLPWLGAFSSHRDFPATDGEAVRVVSELRPEYRPWFAPVFTPRDGNVERLLFGFQAASGFAMIVYCFAHLRASRNQRRDHVTHD